MGDHVWPGYYSPSWVTGVLQSLMSDQGTTVPNGCPRVTGVLQPLFSDPGYYSPWSVTGVLQPLISDRGITAPYGWPGCYSPSWVTGILHPPIGDQGTTAPHRWPGYCSPSWVTGLPQPLIGDRGPHALIGKVLACYDIIMHQIAFNIGPQPYRSPHRRTETRMRKKLYLEFHLFQFVWIYFGIPRISSIITFDAVVVLLTLFLGDVLIICCCWLKTFLLMVDVTEATILTNRNV